MIKENYIRFLAVVLVALVALFMSTEAGAYNQPDGLCPPEEAAVFECVNIDGWIIEIFPDLETGEFPVKTAPDDPLCPSCSVFEYLISGSGNGKAVSILSEFVPVCDKDFDGDGNIDNAIELAGPSLSNNSLKLFPAGAGDSWGWGVDNNDVRVLQWSLQVSPADVERFIAYTTQASSEKTMIRVKIGQTHVAAHILGAACYDPNVAALTGEGYSLDPLNPDRKFLVERNADNTIKNVFACGVDVPNGCVKLSLSPGTTCSVPGQPADQAMTHAKGIVKIGTNTCYQYWTAYGPYTYCYWP
jgi:hypothetical protein